MTPIICNFIGGPGVGKSTLAASAFGELKWSGVLCELVPEVAKGYVWEKHLNMFQTQQLAIFGEQYRAIHRVIDQVDVIITCGSFLNFLLYVRGNEPEGFESLVWGAHKQFDTMNFLVRRRKEYVPIGRFGDEVYARQLDAQAERILQDNNVEYKSLPGERSSVLYIVKKIKERIGFKK